ncbi:hypothetical protein HPB47_004382 [Ixodes persulcatus]|uniref:Uncharacterized protein n=1 Tax=Ixodes persulcatus TaxID=34615 RepID=A0AC60PGU7_IXOPE|nr:hypothetical protein HPB47_004382 [Ixodes persulcatus]
MTSVSFVATLLLSVLALLCRNLVQSVCPKKEEVHPCNCYGFSSYDRVECRAVEDKQLLKRALSKFKGMHIFEFELSLIDMKDVPSDAFKHVQVSELYTYMANFSGLQKSGHLFEGFDSTLYMLEIKRGINLDDWDWTALARLSNLQRLYIFSSNLRKIDRRFSAVSKSLTHVMIQGGDLEVIEDGAFTALRLRDLEISYTRLGHVSRQIFPVPATTLSVLSLRHNNLRYLPEDMFSEMPALTLLDLSANLLKTLSERTISPVIRNLRLLDMSNNQYYCDCNLTWVSRAFKMNDDRFWQRNEITCQWPHQLYGTDVLALTDDALDCPGTRVSTPHQLKIDHGQS